MKKQPVETKLTRPETKICAICGNVFNRYKGISDKVWNARQCCSRNCSNYIRRKPLESLKNKNRAIKRRIDTEKGVITTYAMSTK